MTEINYKMAALMVFLVVLAGCSYTGEPTSIEQGSQVGGTGNVQFSHELLGEKKHLLTITAAPGLLETEGSIAQRIHIFAHKFAAKTCPSSFDFINDPNFSQSIAGGFMKRTRTYTFICKD